MDKEYDLASRIRTQIFWEGDTSLSADINKWLRDEGTNVLIRDIKFSTTTNEDGIPQSAALVIYSIYGGV